MYAVKLSQLMERVRQTANLEGASQFVPDSELIVNINESIAEWYDLVRLTTYGGQYYRVIWPITTDGRTTNLYSLAPNTADVISVDAFTGGPANQPIACIPFTEEQRNIGSFPYTAYNPLGPLRYQIQGDNIAFRPTFPAGVACQVNYTPTAPVLASSGDLLNSWQGWEMFVILDSAIKLAIKDGQYDLIPLLQGRLEQQRERIVWAAAQRDKTHAEPIHDHQAEQFNGLGGLYGDSWGQGGWF